MMLEAVTVLMNCDLFVGLLESLSHRAAKYQPKALFYLVIHKVR